MTAVCAPRTGLRPGIGMPITWPALMGSPVMLTTLGEIDMSQSRLAARLHRENDDAGRDVSIPARV